MKKYLHLFFFGIILCGCGYKPVFETEGNGSKKYPYSIDLVSISTKPEIKNLKFIIKKLDEYGVEINLPNNFYNPSKSMYESYTNSDKNRFMQILNAIKSKNKIIWSVRGGYGGQSIARRLRDYYIKHPLQFKNINKTFIGFSDNTLMGMILNHYYGINFIHGVVLMFNMELASYSKIQINYESSITEVLDLFSANNKYISYHLMPMNNFAKSMKDKMKGTFIGGNISVIERNLFGLLKEINFDNKILFLEDNEDSPEKMREMLEGMFDTGRFDKVKAIIFGNIDLKHKNKNNVKQFIRNLEKYYLSKYLKKPIPIFFASFFGHGKENRPMPMGVDTEIMPYKNDDFILKFDISKFKY